jgi:hypothetical protein
MTLPKLLFELTSLLYSRRFLLVFLALFALLLGITYVVLYNPQPMARQLSLSILSANLTTDDYFSNDNSTIDVRNSSRWYASVHNGVGSPEYVALRIKLLNSSQAVSDDISDISVRPSPGSTVYEIKQMIENNSTLVVPLEWSITDVGKVANNTIIERLNINGNDIENLHLASPSGKNFRFIVELWNYDPNTNDFTYVWSDGQNNRSVWSQIWFNLK